MIKVPKTLSKGSSHCMKTIISLLFFNFLIQAQINTSRIEDYSLPKLEGSNERLICSVRIVTLSTGESVIAHRIMKLSGYTNEIATISEKDLINIIQALDYLVQKEKEETIDEGSPDYVRNSFKTENGFEIGYSFGQTVVWFITLEKTGASSVLFDDWKPLRESFEAGLKKIQELKSARK